jgi:dodecin
MAVFRRCELVWVSQARMASAVATVAFAGLRKGSAMSNHTYRVIEIVGTSPDGVDAAIRSGLARASQTMRGLDWFEVASIRGDLVDGAVAHVQVTMKVGFRLEDS